MAVKRVNLKHLGIPRGGILSPLLYNIYASDQPVSLDILVADYANDKAIISVNEIPLIVTAILQTQLNLLSQWYSKSRMKLNHSKSIHTTFTLKYGFCPPVVVDNIPTP